jgi:hypothetical protein
VSSEYDVVTTHPVTFKYETEENGCGFKIDLWAYRVGCLKVMVWIMFR